MRKPYQEFPEEQDIVTLFLIAIKNCLPWKLWELKTGAPRKGADTLGARKRLERAIAKFHCGINRHPWLLHRYFHLMEMSPTLEAALP